MAVQVCLVCLVFNPHIKDGCEQPMKRVQFVKRALAMVDMLVDDSDVKKHRDLRRTEIERSEANRKSC